MLMILSTLKARLRSLSRIGVVLVAIALLWVTGALPAAATGASQIQLVSPGEAPWVIDEADIISRVNEGKISSVLADLAAETGNEVRIVTIHRLDYGLTPEDFANDLFERWFPTPAEQANQTLLFLDDVTNGVAIRTGDDVKTVMSDDIAKSVAKESVLIPLRQGNLYNQAFLGATSRLVAVLSGQEDPGAPEEDTTVDVAGTFASAEETDDFNATIIVVVLLVLATIIPMATYYWYVR